LVPHSGRADAPVIYGAYGAGPRPRLLGSVSRSEPRDWHPESDHIWATARPTVTDLGLPGDFPAAAWSVYTEGGAKVKTTVAAGADGAPAVLQIACDASGSRANHIQLIMPRVAVREGDGYVLAFRARGTKPLALAQAALMKPSSPWTSYGQGGATRIEVGTEWADHEIRFQATRTAADGRITIFLGGTLPAGAVLSFQPVAWKQMQRDSSAELAVDVGNLLFDGGQSVGVKKWRLADLQQDGDYWYDGDTWQVKLYAQANPAQLHKSIELALRRHIVDQSNRSYVVYEGLALQYGAAHGFGGGDTHHIIVRDCDVGWIGGGHQFTTPEGRPVRFGNGIEFWGNAQDNLVEGCRLWEVYDAALTNQGSANDAQVNITYRDNVIWNCEYSFEYWNRGPESTTRNIRFVHNTCVDAGSGWGHRQRPDRNGRHLMFYVNTAQTTGVCVEGNIFCDATDSCLRMDNDWTAGLTMDHNCWWQRTGVLAQFLRTPFPADQFTEFQKRTQRDLHSMVAEPAFVDAAQRDFRLSPGSPARAAAGDGVPAGSGNRLET
jgi:hypothetical protein